MLNRRGCLLALLLLVLVGCDMRFGTPPTLTPAPTTPPPAPVAVVVWAQDGNLYAWQPDAAAPRLIAPGAVIQPYLSPSGAHVAFTRGAQGDARSLWSINLDGTGEAELAPPDLIPSLRGGHPQINAVAWLDESSLDDQTVYFNTRQDYPSGSVRDDNLYRAQIGAAPRLILPPGAGGDFALAPNSQQIAVTTAGAYDMQKGRVTLLDPLGVTITDPLSFTALSAPNEPPFYLPLDWNGDGSFLRVPVPSRASDRVALWRVPVTGDAQIFGYISALRGGLPVWSRQPFAASDQMLYLRGSDTGAVELVVANANGENPQVYASAPYSSGGIPYYRWLPDAARFAYQRDGTLWLGQTGQPPALLLDPAPAQIIFLPDGTFVYAASGSLSLGFQLDGVTRSTLIATLPLGTPFDAALFTPPAP